MPTDASLIAIGWEESLEKKPPRDLQEFLGSAIELFRGSDEANRGAALALLIESAIENPDGVSNPAYSHANDVLARVEPLIDSFMTEQEVLGLVARVARKVVPKPMVIAAAALAVKLLLKKSKLVKSLAARLQRLVDEEDLEIALAGAVKRFRGLFSCF